MAELLIRASYNDHAVIGDLLTPGGAVALRPPMDRLVADAQTAVLRPSLAVDANLAGVPFLIDPMTPLLQEQTDPGDSWVKRVPFGTEAKYFPGDFTADRIAELVEAVVAFQVERGGTAILPPYLHAQRPDDPAFTASLRMLLATRTYMRQNDVNLPLVALFSGSWQHFARQDAWGYGVDRFLANALDVDPQLLAACFSPFGSADDSYAKAARVFTAALRFSATGVPTVAWRQGTFGEGLVAAGLAGYETGAGTREKADIRDLIARKKPSTRSGTGGPPPKMVYFEGLGRSVTVEVARALLGDLDTRARLICDDESCCPHGVDSMLDHHIRHTINARAKRMRDLNAMPHPTWRLHQVAKDAEQAVRTTRRASLALRRVGIGTRLEPRAQESLARIATHLRTEYAARDSA